MARENSITTGPIYSTIIRLAWPVVASMFLEFALTITDYFWVGYLGTPEQDAIVSSMIVSWTMFATSAIIVTGLTALISRAIGADEKSKAAFFSGQGLMLAIGFGLTLSIIGFILTPNILTFMKASPHVVELGIPYLRLFFVAVIVLFIVEAMGSIFRATGDTRSPMIAFSSGTILNIFLDPALIFGWGPFPEMGLAGAALATVISVVLTLLIFVLLIFRKRLIFSLGRWYRRKPDIQAMLKIVRIGLPISTQNVVFVMVYWFIVQIVHQYGDAAGAAMGIGNRMESLAYLTTFGFSMAASTLVGQNLGAGKPERAAKCAWGTLSIVVAETFLISVLFIVFPKFIAGIFSSDPEVIKIAVDYLIILGLSQVFMGIEIIMEGAFSGAGDTVPPMVVSIPGSLLRLPLAYFLCFTMDVGINGIWWTLTITSFIKASILYFWFKQGHWKKKKI